MDCLADGCEEGRCCPLNACGVCGALPAETCNGADDDCDGETDEPEACDLCSEYELDDDTLMLASSAEDYEVLNLALEGTKAYVRIDDEMVEVVNGFETGRATLPTPSEGLIAAGGGVFATARLDTPYTTSKVYLTRFDKAGTVIDETEIGTTGFYVMTPVYRDGLYAIALGGSAGYGRIDFSIYTGDTDGFTRGRKVDGISSPYNLAIDTLGGVHVGHAVYVSQYNQWWHKLEYEPPDGDDIVLAYKTSHTGRRIDLRIDAQDTVHIVHTEHETNDNVYATIAAGSREVVNQHHFDDYMAMALDPRHSAVILHQPGYDYRHEVHLLRPEDEFVGLSVVNVSDEGYGHITNALVEVDEAGRYHIVFVKWERLGDETTTTLRLHHGVACP